MKDKDENVKYENYFTVHLIGEKKSGKKSGKKPGKKSGKSDNILPDSFPPIHYRAPLIWNCSC